MGFEPAQGVLERAPPEQSNPRVAHLEQENAQLRAALQQLRAEFEYFESRAPMKLPAGTQEPARSAKTRALADPVEGEGDLEEFKSEIRNSMEEVRESVHSLQDSVMNLVEAVATLTSRVDTLKTRVALGESTPGGPGTRVRLEVVYPQKRRALDAVPPMKGQAKAPNMAGALWSPRGHPPPEGTSGAVHPSQPAVIVRDLWKIVNAPALTFANAALCLSAPTREWREWLERRQRQVGRTALGCHGAMTNEATQGDVG
ncbi:hypothetical protein HPB49_022506 [Dermacentor silvarum]|uniref:Uncharacterized protein n=1 Tax=Dermacentor silvarum TaxID=543639 RepID=A0ACB8D0T8_DERSI|nr:hypothetical protein HPB49_022506 [Dermacentor silvarum]